MTSPVPHAPAARPRRRVTRRVVALRVSGLLWAVCSVATVGLAFASLRAEDLNDYRSGYTGPSEDDFDIAAAFTFLLGLLALLTGIALLVDGAVRRRIGQPADGRPGPVPPVS
ncbi:hypothetical protein H9657_15860 [Cellulomonas sp. Sa3CUA2]|uniref:Uncharacterized protein n=1 Tax=Cellulomonas avistercoris TaxID=2762242 RepID=A0ABR8QH38_9CELL|nr:hypothetical protein [Cellulomonas avistercoris]MBD7919747.1 hypothetical protein [Cellulomonas avistercoris]